MNALTKSTGQSLFGPFFRDCFDADSFLNWSGNGTIPAANIAESEKEFTIYLAVPGFKKDDFKVKVEKDTLTITAESKSELSEEKKNILEKSLITAVFPVHFVYPTMFRMMPFQRDMITGF